MRTRERVIQLKLTYTYKEIQERLKEERGNRDNHQESLYAGNKVQPHKFSC